MLTPLLSILFTTALASPSTDADPATAESAVRKQKQKSQDGAKGDDDDLSKMKGKLLGFTWEPFVQPGGGVQIDGSGDTAITAGVDVGVRYWKRKIKGELYVGGAYLTSAELAGYDLHLGNKTGYRPKYWGAALGVLGTYNGQSNLLTGEDVLKPAFGVGVPVELTVGPKKYYAKGGVMPSWYFDDARKPAPGLGPLGDEFTWNVAAGLKLGQFKGELGFAQRITGAATYNTPTVNVGWNP